MRAARHDQIRLLELAELDLEITQLRHHAANLPELATLRELGAKRDETNERLVKARTALADNEVETQRLEADLNPARDRLVRQRDLLNGGTIQDSKQLQSLGDEVEHLTGRIARLEDAELELLEAREQIQQQIDAIEAERTTIETEAKGLIRVRDEALAADKQAFATASTTRRELATLVPAELLATYDKIAARTGFGAARLEDGRCSGCHVAATPDDLRTYQRAADDDVVRCEECGRILIR